MNIFGNENALIGSIALLIGGAMFLGGAVLRKFLNDMNIRFSIIGCTALGFVGFVIADNLIAFKWALLISIFAFFIGGFGLSFIGGESSDSGEELGGGNYEE